MSSLEKKRKRMTTKSKKKKPSLILSPTPQSSTPIPSLPGDLLLSCLARVSRLYYPTFSLVSKSFRSLLASPELYKTRSSLNLTESCLYMCLVFHPEPNPRWFTLCRKPDQTITNDNNHDKKKKKKKKKSIGYVLAEIPVLHSRPAHSSGLVAVGCNIYNIGGPIEKEPSSSVSILDCRSHTWLEAPSMKVKRNYPAANVLEGKIYVAGGCQDCNYSNWMEVFDPKTQTWELVPSRGSDICGCEYIEKSAGVDGKVYIFGNYKGLAYEPKESRWEMVGEEMDLGWVWYSYGVIDNVLYYYNEGDFKWYDSKVRLWRNLKGVKGLPKFARYRVRLADYGGKMAVLWDKIIPSSGYTDRMIWCAVIALDRRSNGEEIWGKVEWHDAVLKVPKSCSVDYALSVTV